MSARPTRVAAIALLAALIGTIAWLASRVLADLWVSAITWMQP